MLNQDYDTYCVTPYDALRVKPLQNDIVAKREVYLDVDVAKSSFVAVAE